MLSVILLVISSLSPSQNHDVFMPENDLYLEDVLDKSTAGQETFNQVIDIANTLYQPVARQNNERLVFNRYWTDSTVNASMMRSGGVVTVNMYGGLFRRAEVTPEAFALVVCHELGHAYGGTPYLRPASKISAEGQSDYFGAKVCLKKVLEVFDESQEASALDVPYANETCAEDDSMCVRGLKAGFGLGTLLSKLGNGPAVAFETPDLSVVTSTQLSYPKTAQCRLDTYRAGTLGQDRPLCWFKPTNFVW